MATVTTTAGAGREAQAPAKTNRTKPSKPPVRAADRAEAQRKRAGRVSYRQPTNMGMPDPIISAKRVIMGSGNKVDTKG